MTENGRLEGAILDSLQGEKEAMDFYAMCEAMSMRAETRAFFGLLASEEREHARMFHRLAEGESGRFDEFIAKHPDAESGWIGGLGRVDGAFSEAEAMRFALEKERELEEEHLRKLETAEDAGARAMYELNARETRNHISLIEAEYARVMGMPHEADLESFRA
jgi:rubrerythrin